MAIALLGSAVLHASQGLLISPCNSVHTWFMQYPIDVVFLDADKAVLLVAPDVQPWRAKTCWAAKSALELAAGRAAHLGIAAGSKLEWR